MKKTRFIISILILAGACTKAPRPGEGADDIQVERNASLGYSVTEGATINLEDYLVVRGGVSPYAYATSLGSEFQPTLQRTVPAVSQSPAEYGIYVKDSKGAVTSRPFVLSLRILPPIRQTDEELAFPGAYGGGRYTTGGRGGKVVYVENLLDEYPDPPAGSLRWALNQQGPKIIMFKVSGVIELKAKLYIRNDGRYAGTGKDVTIAGESAPGDGICIKNWPLSIVYADNIMIRFLRFRLGDDIDTGGAQDAFDGTSSKNIIIDHCSMAWSVDECSSFYRNRNFTMQWCILTESLRESNHEKGTPHGYGGIWGGKDASYHHNLLSRHDSRNPRFDASGSYPSSFPESEWRGNVDFRNNVIYGWGGEVTYGGEGGRFNMINNFYKEGPLSPARNRFITAYAAAEDEDDEVGEGRVGYPTLYMSGNYYQTKQGGANNSINNDNYAGIIWNSQPLPPTLPPAAELTILGKTGEEHTLTETAIAAYNSVLDCAGAWPRDKVDARAAGDARSGTNTGYVAGATPSKAGLIDHPWQVGGWPSYNQSTPAADTDGDGVPDEWEDARGLDRNDPADGALRTLDEFYSNVEVYLHELAAQKIAEQKSNTY